MVKYDQIQRQFIEGATELGVPLKFHTEHLLPRRSDPPADLKLLTEREVADTYDIPPWMLNAAHNTPKERWRWRLRHVRRARRWFQRTFKFATIGGPKPCKTGPENHQT